MKHFAKKQFEMNIEEEPAEGMGESAEAESGFVDIQSDGMQTEHVKKDKSALKRTLPLVAVLLIFLIGVGVLVYPLISSMVNNVEARKGAHDYIQKAQELDTSEIDAMRAQAQKYNDSLHRIILTDPFDADSYGLIGDNYTETLNMDSRGLIGYVEVPKIDVYLPIFHGTSLEVLSMGAGHLEQTSLPIGGEGSHSVISAHSAWPGQTFFDYLEELEIGDEFYIHVLNDTLKYEVDEINVVLPDDTSNLYIDDTKDYVTLLTCTPYSVNTHRLLVRGERVPYEAPNDNVDRLQTVTIGEGFVYFLGYKLPYLTVGLSIGGFVLFVGIVVSLMIYVNRRKKRREGP